MLWIVKKSRGKVLSVLIGKSIFSVLFYATDRGIKLVLAKLLLLA
jgi:hypothetical protein